MPSPPLDSNVRRDKRTYYRGRAKIFLENLEYRGTSSRGNVDDKHVDHLILVFRTEGCMRLHDPEHYVPALITPDDLTDAAMFSRLRLLDLTQDGEPPTLSLPSNLKVRILHGEHRLRAAERFLEPSERWWVVVLYTTDLGESTRDAIREEYSHQLKFTDGDIYRNIRLHASRQDTYRVDKWKARLSDSKRDLLCQLDRKFNHPIRDGLDRNLPFCGLWDALTTGSLVGFYLFVVLKYVSNISLKFVLALIGTQEFAHYLFKIYEMWAFVMQDSQLFNLVDTQTVQLLETLTPEASHDSSLIAHMIDQGEIFPAIDDGFIRLEIKARILQLTGRVLSFKTFFDDWKYMEPLAKSLRPLLPPGLTGSLRDSFFSHFENNRSSPSEFKIQTAEHGRNVQQLCEQVTLAISRGE